VQSTAIWLADVVGQGPQLCCVVDLFQNTLSRRITVDAPAVLGWTRWTEIGNRYNIGLVRALLTNAVETGCIPPQPIEATALTMLGAMREVTLYVARAEDHHQARQEAGAVMNRLIHALSAN
jgi:hypothetical protein